MQLTLIEKPGSEIITLEETKNYLRIDHDFDDSLIELLIKSTREAMESIIEKSIIKQTWQYTVDVDQICKSHSGNKKYLDVFCDVLIPLPNPPVIKLISIAIDDKILEDQEYKLKNKNNKFYVSISSLQEFCKNKEALIKIVYEAGITGNSKDVPYQLKLANLMLVASAYQERYSYKQNEILSQGVKQLLGPFLNLSIL